MGLYCSPKCEEAEAKAQADDAAALVKAGFQQSQTDKRAYEKDGVTLTLGEVKANGIEQALALHAAVSAAKK